MISFEHPPDWLRPDLEALRTWLHSVAEAYDSQILNLAYRFVGDDEIRAANRQYLNHDYFTDIITFGYQEGQKVEGEILIGYETVATNAEKFGVDVYDEMCRVIVHGLLHLIGFKDQTFVEKEEMRANEDKCLILRPKNLRDS